MLWSSYDKYPNKYFIMKLWLRSVYLLKIFFFLAIYCNSISCYPLFISYHNKIYHLLYRYVKFTFISFDPMVSLLFIYFFSWSIKFNSFFFFLNWMPIWDPTKELFRTAIFIHNYDKSNPKFTSFVLTQY